MKSRNNYEYFCQKLSRPQKNGKQPPRGRDPRLKTTALDTEPSDNKDIQRRLRHQYCAANKMQASFSRCSIAVKTYVFVPSVRRCMHHDHGAISGCHACRDYVWPIQLNFVCRAL